MAKGKKFIKAAARAVGGASYAAGQMVRHPIKVVKEAAAYHAKGKMPKYRGGTKASAFHAGTARKKIMKRKDRALNIK